MKLKWIDICDRFLPLLVNIIYILILSFNVTIDGFNILVNPNYYVVTYIYLGIIISLYILSIVLHKSYYFKNRSFLFIVFLIVALGVSPKIGGYQYFSTFILLFSALDTLALLFKMVYDSYYTEERLKTIALPPNQFSNSNKILSRILNYSGFVLFFIICFIVFYYNEVKVSSVLILLLIGLVIVSIIQIISMSVSVSPLNKYINKYEKALDLAEFETNLNSLKDVNLHKETLNLIDITLWKYYSLADLNKANKIKEKIFKPNVDNILKDYYDAYFYYLLGTKQYDMLLSNKRLFVKNVKDKAFSKAILGVLNNEYIKYNPNKDKFSIELNNIYQDLSSKLLKFDSYNYIKFNLVELESIYSLVLSKLSNYYNLNDYLETIDDYVTINNKLIGAIKIANIKMTNNKEYYNDFIYNINLIYSVYPLMLEINKLIVSSRFKDKYKELYGEYSYNALLEQYNFKNYSDIKNDLIKLETTIFDENISVKDRIANIIARRNNISINLGYSNYLERLAKRYNNLVEDYKYSALTYKINDTLNLDNIKDKDYKEYLNFLKKHHLYQYDSNLYTTTYYINSYRSPFISINSDNLDYNDLYFNLGIGYTYYKNNNNDIPKYLLLVSGYLNATILSGSDLYIKYSKERYYNLYIRYSNIYFNGYPVESDYKSIILDENPYDHLFALMIVEKIIEGTSDLVKVFVSLNQKLDKTSERDIFNKLGLLDLYNKFLIH